MRLNIDIKNFQTRMFFNIFYLLVCKYLLERERERERERIFPIRLKCARTHIADFELFIQKRFFCINNFPCDLKRKFRSFFWKLIKASGFFTSAIASSGLESGHDCLFNGRSECPTWLLCSSVSIQVNIFTMQKGIFKNYKTNILLID